MNQFFKILLFFFITSIAFAQTSEQQKLEEKKAQILKEIADNNKDKIPTILYYQDGELVYVVERDDDNMINAGDLQKKLIVILNDNEMSISKNVGAMSEYLYRIRTDPMYSRIKFDATIIFSFSISFNELIKNSLSFVAITIGNFK